MDAINRLAVRCELFQRNGLRWLGRAVLICCMLILLTGCTAGPDSRHGSQDSGVPLSSGLVYWTHQGGVVPEQVVRAIQYDFKRLRELSGTDSELVLSGSAVVNAYAARKPGVQGEVTLNAGLIDLLGNDRAAVNFVLGHELGHIALGHLSDQHRAERQKQVNMADFVGAMLDLVVPFASLAVTAGQTLLDASYSREQEMEADRFGLHLAMQAGFDGRGAVRFQQRIEQVPSETLPLLATHPAYRERISALEAELKSLPISP